MKCIYPTYCVALLIVFFSATCCADSQINETPFLEIKKNNDVVTIEAYSVPLQDIFASLSELTDIKINTFYSLTQATSIFAQDIALEALIKKLVTGYNHMIIYGNMTSSDNVFSIKQVNIYYKSQLTNQTKSKYRSEFVNKGVKAELDAIYQNEFVDQQLDYVDSLKQGVDTDVVPELTKLLLNIDNEIVKSYVINTLGEYQGKIVIDALAKGLGDKNPAIRKAIVNVLMYQQHKDASLILAQLLYGDSNADIRKLAAETIRIRNTEHMVSFLKAAQNDKDESVRSAAFLY